MSTDDEWYGFRDLAVSRVRAGFAPERLPGHNDDLLLRLMEYPASGIVTGWHIYQRHPRREGTLRYIANQIQWQQPDDWTKFASPIEKVKYIRLAGSGRLMPALTFATVDVEVATVEKVLARLRTIHIPFIPSAQSFGIDGVFYELATADSYANLSIHWWGDAKAEWQPIGELTMQLLQALETLVNQMQQTGAEDAL